MNDFYLFVAATALLVTILSITSRAAHGRLDWLPEGAMALGLGLFLGPYGSGLIAAPALTAAGETLETAALLTLAVAVMAAALRSGPRWSRTGWRDLALLWLLGQALMALIGGLLSWALLPVSSLALALLIGAVLTPTDPVLTQPIVAGPTAQRYVPHPLRRLLSMESGGNDGLAIFAVTLPLLWLDPGDRPGMTLLWMLVWQVGAMALFGIAIGWAASWLILRADSEGWADRSSLSIVGLAVAMLCLGLGELAGGDSLIAVFTAGLMLARGLKPALERAQARFEETTERLFFLPVLVLTGLALPVADWLALGWPLLAFALLVIGLRRIPVLLLLQPGLSMVTGRREALFAGWFGPVGVAAIYWALHSRDGADAKLVFAVSSAAVCASALFQGVSATPGGRWLGRAEQAA